MKYTDFQKTQRKHVRCVVCGHGFSSDYDDQLKAYPVFHPMGDERFECERRFFKALLIIYAHIHQSHISVSMNSLLVKFDWRTTVLMKKEYLIWSMARGYLATDKLNRILVPEPVNEACRDLFSEIDLNDDEAVNDAIDLLIAALKCLRSELKCLSKEEMPINVRDDKSEDKPSHRSSEPLDEELDEEKPNQAKHVGMATADRTGAKDFGARQTSARGSMQRKRV